MYMGFRMSQMSSANTSLWESACSGQTNGTTLTTSIITCTVKSYFVGHYFFWFGGLPES